MNNELLTILNYIEQERGISRDVLVDALEKALVSASRKSIHPANDLTVKIDKENGDIRAWARLEVVDDIPNEDQITLARAQEKFPEVKAGDVIDWEVTPRNFGRIAAQTARQTIMQQLRKAEKEIVQEEFEDMVGHLVSGVVRRFESGSIIVDMQKAEGIITYKEKIPGETYMAGDRINALLIDVETKGSGPSLILSRARNDFIRRLFEREVSEIHDGVVEIRAIAREPGARSKIAVASNDAHVDPIGACVGMRGMRVKNITSELGGEKIDIIRHDDDLKTYVSNALQPANLKSIEIDEDSEVIHVKVEADQLSLAIGKRGQNVRLTSKLVGWKVNIGEAEDATVSFEKQIEQAVSSLSGHLGIESELAAKLVSHGFTTIDGLKEAGVDDLLAVEGVSGEDAENIREAIEKLNGKDSQS